MRTQGPRIAERRRYRARHTETATCKRCGQRFDRSATSQRKKVYCTKKCQYRERSITYCRRPDICAPLVRGRREL